MPEGVIDESTLFESTSSSDIYLEVGWFLDEMPPKPVVLAFEKPHFQVKLHSDTLEVDLKEGARKELEKLAEARPFLRENVGWLLQTIIPLDVKLSQIEKVDADTTGKVHISIPYRRDISIPLDPSESRQLVQKLNELIPVEKEKAQEHERAMHQALEQKERYKTEDLKNVRRGV